MYKVAFFQGFDWFTHISRRDYPFQCIIYMKILSTEKVTANYSQIQFADKAICIRLNDSWIYCIPTEIKTFRTRYAIGNLG